MSKTIRLNLSRISGAPPTTQRSVSQAGIGGRALESLGGTIAQAGATIGNTIQRRRDEEDRDLVSTQGTLDKLRSLDESENLKQIFIGNGTWRGYADEVSKVQTKRQQKLMKNVTSQRAREVLESDFEISRLKSSLAATNWERNQFTKISIGNIANSANLSAQADFQSPPDPEELRMDILEDQLDIEGRDIDPETKSEAGKNALSIRMKGAILGYTEGGQPQDFQRARDFLDSMKDKVSPDKFDRLSKTIASRQLKIQERSNRAERQERIFVEKKFKAEINELDDYIEMVNENPDADISVPLTRMTAEGKLEVSGTPRLISRVRMGIVQKEVSDTIRLKLLDALSETEDPEDIRSEYLEATLSGQLSTQDASAVLKSINTRKNSKYARSQFKLAKNIVKAAFKPTFNSLVKKQQRLLEVKILADIEALSVEHAIDPVRASKIILKDRGMLDLPDIPKVKGTVHDQNTLEGIEEINKEIARDIRAGTISSREAIDKIRILKRRATALEVLPSLDEVKRSGRK